MRDGEDVVIAGGGFAGLGLAVALKQELGASFAVTVVDPSLGSGPSRDGRASAIAAAARRFSAISACGRPSRPRPSRSSTWW